MHQHPLLRLIGPLFVALILLPLGFAPQPQPTSAAVSRPEAAPIADQASRNETEPNDTIAQAQQNIYAPPSGSWALTITGSITSTTDVDYYAFTLAEPASRVQIGLANLPADYDLVLAADPDATADQGSSGVDDITGIGGTINAIGGTINAIGGTINAIGGTINAIGGTINAIGGTINAISANAGLANESIDTFLWQPGTYYVAVGAANGATSSSPYTLTVQVTGSSLAKAPAPPTVQMRVAPPTYNGANPITTLYVVSPSRMTQLYGSTQSISITTALNSLATTGLVTTNPLAQQVGPIEYGYVLNLDNLKAISTQTPIIDGLYSDWLANQANPFYANRLARTIDNLIKAASDPSRDGATSCPAPASLPAGAKPCPAATAYYESSVGAQPNPDAPFPNVKYIVLVGGDNVIPFFRTPDLTTIANEADYATYLKSLDASGVIDPGTPQGAALKYRMTLSDNPYGSDKPLRFQGFPLFVPNRAVGRLVESAEDILRYLNYWDSRNNYLVDTSMGGDGPSRAYVNGYDFLKDEAGAISQTLTAGLTYTPTLLAPDISGPINDSWTRADLVSSWFGTDLSATGPFTSPSGYTATLGVFSQPPTLNNPNASHPNKLFSLNSHFDHWQILPAVGADTAGGTFLAQRIAAPSYYLDPLYGNDPLYGTPYGGYFGGTLGYSVGCHSGYNVIDNGITFGTRDPRYDLYRADFAQAFVRQAGNWIGNTGYGYGSPDGIDYSERLSFFLTQELLRDVRGPNVQTGSYDYTGAAIGVALARAKQRYIRNVAGLSAYDAKALTVMTLYGLPFIKVVVDNPLPPPPEEQQFRGGTPVDAPGASPAPVSPPLTGNGLLERTITVTLGLPAAQPVPRTGSQQIIVGTKNFTVEDSFVQGSFPAPQIRPIQNNQAGLPNLPAFAYDISALDQAGTSRLQVRDVVFVSGQYDAPIPFDPQITEVVTETDSPIISTGEEPSFAAGAGIWYPDKFFAFSSVGQGQEQRDQLIATAAQFKADSNGVTGQLRRYKKMVFKVYYIDPRAQSAAQALADETAPTIQSVQIEMGPAANAQAGALAAATSSLKVVAIVSKDSAAEQSVVSGVYIKNGTDWTPVTFTRVSTDGALERWEATIDLPPGEVRAIISATDAAGNVSYYTAKGTFNIGGSQVYLPIVRR